MLEAHRINAKREETGAMKDQYAESITTERSTAAGEMCRRTEAFLVRIEQQEHATWQGTVTWANRKRTAHFRSVLELIKLIDSTLTEQGKGEET